MGDVTHLAIRPSSIVLSSLQEQEILYVRHHGRGRRGGFMNVLQHAGRRGNGALVGGKLLALAPVSSCDRRTRAPPKICVTPTRTEWETAPVDAGDNSASTGTTHYNRSGHIW